MKHKFVHLGCEGDIGRFYIECSVAECNNVYYSRIPNETLSGIKRCLYRCHNNSIIKLPFKSVWAKSILDPLVKKKIKKDDYICFMLSGLQYRFLDVGLLEYLRNEYKNCKIVYSFPDRVELYQKRFKNFNVDELKKKFDLVTTYNAIDADVYSLHKSPQKLVHYPEIVFDQRIEESDVFFIGNEKGRLDTIIDIYEKCKSEGLKCDFWIFGVKDNAQKHKEDIHYNIKLPYIDVLKHVKATKAVVNIIQEGAYGVTLRDYEAIGFNKVLITNCDAIKNTAFFAKEKVIYTNENPQYSMRIKQGEKYSWKMSEAFSSQNWYVWFENELEALS